MAKSIEDRLLAFALIGVASTLAGGVALIVTGLPARAAIGYVVVSTCFHIAYESGLINSYRLGAFNQTYPIARGTSPLVVAVGAYFLAHEHLSLLAWSGIVILAVGLMSMAFSAGSHGQNCQPSAPPSPRVSLLPPTPSSTVSGSAALTTRTPTPRSSFSCRARCTRSSTSYAGGPWHGAR